MDGLERQVEEKRNLRVIQAVISDNVNGALAKELRGVLVGVTVLARIHVVRHTVVSEVVARPAVVRIVTAKPLQSPPSDPTVNREQTIATLQNTKNSHALLELVVGSRDT